ncbi:MAG: phage major capsid protein [Maricaulaceae bacterium]|nr:phage major capsid protein [Maricaulaceae bacterium]
MTTETKMKTPSAETRAALGEVLCAFEAFKEANDRRLSEIEKKAGADPLTEDKLGRIDAALSGHQQALDRLLLDARRPGLESPAAREAKSAWARYMRAGDAAALAEVKSLSPLAGAGGLVRLIHKAAPNPLSRC